MVKMPPHFRGGICLLQMPVKRGRPKKEMPFRPERRHHYWTTDIRYLDMHNLGGGMIYCISILENFSRAILASVISRSQDSEVYFSVLYAAVRKHGVPGFLMSDFLYSIKRSRPNPRGRLFISPVSRMISVLPTFPICCRLVTDILKRAVRKKGQDRPVLKRYEA